MTSARIGFIGLGMMGEPMARNLLRAGYSLRVYDAQENRLSPLVAEGATPCGQLSAVAEPGGIVLSMVPDDDALRAITLGAGGLLEKLCPGGVHVSLSTISPSLSQRLAALYAERGGTFLAGTVLGRPDVAKLAALFISIAGEPSAMERVRPLLHALGNHVVDLGEDVTAANVFKLAANFLILAALEAMGEAGALLDAYGVNRKDFFRSMVESPLFGGAVYTGYGSMIGTQNFLDGNFPVGMGIKDGLLVREAAESVDLVMPTLELALRHLYAAVDAGRADESWAVLAEFASSPVEQMTAPMS